MAREADARIASLKAQLEAIHAEKPLDEVTVRLKISSTGRVKGGVVELLDNTCDEPKCRVVHDSVRVEC